MVDVVLESHLRTDLAKLVAERLPARHYAIVMDTNTAKALGNDVAHALGDTATPIMLEGTPKASMEHVEHIKASSEHADVLIAVGSGTINDLTKYASFLSEKPYGVFPTAPSMNGYSSANASILQGAHKTTLPAQAPRAIWCDLSVIAAAPTRLIQSGLGDSLCRTTAQFDWLLSHLLLDTPYSAEPFEMLAPYESELFASADSLLARDEKAITLLMQTLLASGDGMRMSGGSHPASQAEHMIAHTVEMMMPPSSSKHYHGEEIAVTTLIAAHMQHEWIAQESPPRFTLNPFPSDVVRQHFSPVQCTAFQQAYAEKCTAINSSNVQARLDNHWDDIRGKLSNIMLPLATLENTLAYAEMHRTSEALGWGAMYNSALTAAPFTRNRFTILEVT